MASDDIQTNIRIPSDLKDRLVSSADENNRSLSAEITSRLEASFDGTGASQESQRLMLRLERQAFSAEMDAANLQMTLGLFAARVVDLLTMVEADVPVPPEAIEQMRESCNEALKEGQSGYEASLRIERETISVAARMRALARESGSAKVLIPLPKTQIAVVNEKGDAQGRRKITMVKTDHSEVEGKDASGRPRKIKVEVRKKRTFIKRERTPLVQQDPDDEKSDE